MTAQEISQFDRHGLRPIVLVLNNSGYLSERMLCKDMALGYNDIAAWNYAELPHALGCQGWFTARVRSCGVLDDALKTAGQADGVRNAMQGYGAGLQRHRGLELCRASARPGLPGVVHRAGEELRRA